MYINSFMSFLFAINERVLVLKMSSLLAGTLVNVILPPSTVTVEATQVRSSKRKVAYDETLERTRQSMDGPVAESKVGASEMA